MRVLLLALLVASSEAHTRDGYSGSRGPRDINTPDGLRTFNGNQLDVVQFYLRMAATTAGEGRYGIAGLENDQGRLYFALGAPARVTKFPSSSLFCPLEIWHYQQLPQLKIYHSVQFLFFKEQATGRYRMFSPSIDTMLKLLQ